MQLLSAPRRRPRSSARSGGRSLNMRIVYLGASALPSAGRANTIQTMAMCSAFSTNGHEVVLIAPDRPDRIKDTDPHTYYGVPPAFRIEHLPWYHWKGRGYLYGWAAARRARELRPDLVYGRSLIGCRVAAGLRMPTIFEIHQPVPRADILLRFALSGLTRQPNLKRLVTISEPMVDYFRSEFGMPASRISLAPNGAQDIGHTGASVALGPGALHAGYVGGLQPGKGMQLIVKVAAATPWATYHVVGGTPSEISEWEAACAGLENVRFHGHVSPAETERFRRSFDVLLAPYHAPAGSLSPDRARTAWLSPLKLPEYMAAGKPIVCSDLAAYRAVLSHEQTALFCAPDDVGAWVDALTRLRDDPPLRSRLGQAAHREFIEHYTWEARARRVLEGLT